MNEGQQEDMDSAALQARSELNRHLAEWRTKEIAQWWRRWYMRAGHKRLGRVLLDIANQDETLNGTKSV